MRIDCLKARLVAAVAIALIPASLFAAQPDAVPGHQKNGGTAGGFSGALDGVDYSGRGVIQLGDLDGDGVEVSRVGVTARVGPGLSEAPEAMGDWVLKTPRTAPSPRRVPSAMAYDSARGVAVLFGGFDGAQDDETWEWDGVNWTQRIVSPRPSPRVTIAMAYDSARGVTVLFGGVTPTGLSNETWEWDGTSWALRSSTGPAPRQWHAMAYDRVRGVTVMFGGNLGGGSGITDDTWEWDGTSWTLLGGSRPRALWTHVLAYDAVGARIILFGGKDQANVLYDDTWALGAGGWTLVPTLTRPSPRAAPGMVGDPGGIVLFGGLLDSGRSDETWDWDGADWSLRPTTTSPSRRGIHAMAYDSARGQVVLFGGDDGILILNDTWELTAATCPPCACDWDGDPVCLFFDFLFFQNAFVLSDPCACGFDGNPACSFFDFLFFQDEFVLGCP